MGGKHTKLEGSWWWILEIQFRTFQRFKSSQLVTDNSNLKVSRFSKLYNLKNPDPDNLNLKI